MERVAILGCGWLGCAFGRWAVSQGWSAVGSSRRAEQMAHLQSLGLETAALPLPLSGAIPDHFAGDVLLIALPLRAETPIDDIVLIAARFVAQGGQRIVLISTTAVYGNGKGVITEETPISPETESAKRNAALEQALLTNFPEQTKVLRLSGLIGEDRHPITSLAGRELTFGGRPVNLIHQDDAVAAIWALCHWQGARSIFHLAMLDHPSRKAYYEAQAQKRHLPAPIFLDENGGDEKQIDASETVSCLRLTFQHRL